MVVIPGDGNDIADPDAHEIGYANTPIDPLISLIDDGLAPLSARYGELVQPLLLITSRQDHTIEPAQSERLAASYGGPVDHRWLERSYHVATLDFDRDVVAVAAVEFARKVTAAS
jgi:carboxylesterase